MRRNNPAGLCLLSWLLVNAATATAAGSAPLPPNVTLGELESAQAQNLLLEQKVQTARLQQQLRESQTAVTSALSQAAVVPPLTSYPSAGQMPASQAQAKDSGSPAATQPASIRLVEIYGSPGKLRARLQLPGGGIAEVVKGDPIPGTSKRVTAVTETVVRLSDDTELSF
ncbi:pilus assembly protein PilP [Pantoea deleyi]|uniref:Type IV pilus biogenesis protein PilP n=1 Tax=Pantoea deleyi TaxID=470932 RepID=A0A506QTB4_9GAMM|nr:type IV pilus biogenesis protein PilP [Pantoea deleyi]ORM84308.1 pilus assembly protein PilP [Pantoea deleyi]TPV49603.1 type IV pilus biogenesis protein PilP [Pantoea deleyi]